MSFPKASYIHRYHIATLQIFFQEKVRIMFGSQKWTRTMFVKEALLMNIIILLIFFPHQNNFELNFKKIPKSIRFFIEWIEFLEGKPYSIPIYLDLNSNCVCTIR